MLIVIVLDVQIFFIFVTFLFVLVLFPSFCSDVHHLFISLTKCLQLSIEVISVFFFFLIMKEYN